MEKTQNFLLDVKIPANIDSIREKVSHFVRIQKTAGKNIALVTSGGTTVPLESRTVRFIDNFSVGTRGSSSAEYFLEQGYSVIFLHRRRSLEPYSRHFSRDFFLDFLTLPSSHDQPITVDESCNPKLRHILKKYQDVMQNGSLLKIDFQSISEYLHMLRAITQELSILSKNALLYLAAAVSDFYIPESELPEHKIQSSDGPLQIKLQLVPKMLGPLVREWVPQSFVVSFKLETDPALLLMKSRKALDTYHHQVVIGNILETRKHSVVLVTKNEENWIHLSESEIKDGIEIEERIVKELIERHKSYCDNS